MRAAGGLFLPLLILAAAPAAAQDSEWADEEEAEGAYPFRDVAQAFATACSGVENPAVNRASALAAGWQPYDPAADSRMGRIIAYGKAKLAEEDAHDVAEGLSPTQILPGAQYQMTVAERPLHLVLSGVEIDDITTYGCRVYDFDADAAPDAETVESWTSRTPNATERPSPGLVKYIWNPGMKPGHYQLEIAYVAPGASPVKDLPLQGLVMTALAMEIEGL